MVVNDHVMIGSMRYAVRWSEELIMKLLFLHHPLLANKGILYDGAAERRHNYTLEGGDVHPLRHDTVIIGFSERSSPAALDHLPSPLFAETAIPAAIPVLTPQATTAPRDTGAARWGATHSKAGWRCAVRYVVPGIAAMTESGNKARTGSNARMRTLRWVGQ